MLSVDSVEKKPSGSERRKRKAEIDSLSEQSRKLMCMANYIEQKRKGSSIRDLEDSPQTSKVSATVQSSSGLTVPENTGTLQPQETNEQLRCTPSDCCGDRSTLLPQSTGESAKVQTAAADAEFLQHEVLILPTMHCIFIYFPDILYIFYFYHTM